MACIPASRASSSGSSGSPTGFEAMRLMVVLGEAEVRTVAVPIQDVFPPGEGGEPVIYPPLVGSQARTCVGGSPPRP
eukprot:5547272-Pyramimonas_sp.AAC.1